MRTSQIWFFLFIASLTCNITYAQSGDQDEASVNRNGSVVEPVIEHDENSEWVLVFNDPRPARLQGWIRNSYSKGSGEYRGSLDLERFGRSMATKYKMELRDQWLIPSLGVYCLVVRFNDDESKTMANLKMNKAVKWIQASNDFKLLSVNSNSSSSEQSQPTQIDGNYVIKNADGNGVVIAIIDSAVDDSHQDLNGQIDQSGDFVVAGTSSNSSSNTEQRPGEQHGTAIAGVVIADRDTKLGVAGVAPGATLRAYRGCWENSDTQQTNCNTLSLARALDAVISNNADILNLSLSGPKDILLDLLVQRLIDRGTLVVTAFDPARPTTSRFPTQREGVLVVRAQDLDEKHTAFFTAPGARVVTSPGNTYDFMHGHSIASAYTSGLLALRKQVFETQYSNSKNKIDWRTVSRDEAAEDLLNDIIGDTNISPDNTTTAIQ